MMPMAQFVAFDLETTGLETSKNEIIEVGGVKFVLEVQGTGVTAKIQDTFESLVKPSMLIPEEATRINKITNEMVENAPPIGEVLQQFTRFCGLSTVLIAHNAEFDTRFLQAAFRRNPQLLLRNPILDSLKLARKIMPESRSHKLADLARIMKTTMGGNSIIINENLHRALYDCQVLMQVVICLLNKRFRSKDLELGSMLRTIEKVHGPASFIQ